MLTDLPGFTVAFLQRLINIKEKNKISDRTTRVPSSFAERPKSQKVGVQKMPPE